MDFAKVRTFREDIRREFAAVDSEMDALARRKTQLELLIQNLNVILSEVEPDIVTTSGVAAPAPFDGTACVATQSDASQAKSRPAMIAEILDHSGVPVTTAVICATLREQGDGVGAEEHDFWRTVDSALRKGQEKWGFRRTGKALWTRSKDIGRPSVDPPIAAHLNGHPSESARTIAASAEEIIRRAGRPMSVSEIMKRLSEAGQHVPSNPENFYNSVYSALSRSPKFDKAGRGTWRLAGLGVEGQSLFQDDR